ncbi:MAG: hypothetical protein ACI9OU_002326 [Candidatus Promineifilaceae bacterium]|jgi:hypothetical protein
MIWLVFATLGTVLIPGLFLILREAPFPAEAYFAGVGISLINGFVATLTNRMAIGRESQTFLLRAALGHGTRVALLAGIVVGAAIGDVPNHKALIMTIFCGYFIFQVSEIAMLQRGRYGTRSILSKTEL